MKNFSVVFCVTIWSVLAAQAVEVEGVALLAGGHDPRGIQIIFTEASPSAETDTAITDVHGIFDLFLQAGWYHVTYHRFGYAVYDFGLLNLRNNLAMAPVTLMPSLSGRLNGTVGPGDFHVTDSLYVADGETATLAPGTHLYFSRVIPFHIAGRLIAVGTSEDSILFGRRYTTGFQATWRGLRFVNADDNSLLQYVIIEHATKAEYDRGGGVYGRNSSLIITRSTFRYNHADYGGGAYFENCAPQIEGCTFFANVANGGAGLGLSHAAARVRDCDFEQNSAFYSGGGLYADGDSVISVGNCRFEANEAWDGGGAAILHSPIEMHECVFTENYSSRAAGLLFNDADGAVISRCTLSGNRGPMSAAFSSVAIFGGTPEMTTTIISETNVNYGILFSVADQASVHHCDIFVTGGVPLGFSASDSAMGPPGIGILDTLNMRGDTCDAYQNIFLNPEFNDSVAYHLEYWSPCIDTGDPESPYDPDGSVADMGAFYYTPPQAADPRQTAVCIYHLGQNYPNPFNSSTQIQFNLPRAGDVSLELFDVTGRHVRTLLSGYQSAGQHQIHFDAGTLPSGLYFYRLQSGEFVQTQKLMLIK